MRHFLGCLRVLTIAAFVATAGATPTIVDAAHGCLVTSNAGRFGSLQAAVNATRAGRTIVVRGTCVGSTAINRKPLVIRGRWTKVFGQPILDGNGADYVLADSSDLTVSDLTIRDGRIGFQVGRKSDTTVNPVVKLARVGITDTLTAIDADGVVLTVESGDIHDNGMGIAVTGFGTMLTVRSTDISDNTDGGIHSHIGPSLLLRDSQVHHNGGEGIYASDGGPVTLAGRTRVHHNAGRGVFTDIAGVVLRDSASVYRNGGTGVRLHGGSVTCRDRSSIHHNGEYGVMISFRGGDYTGCVAGDNVHDNVPGDIQCNGGIVGLPEGC